MDVNETYEGRAIDLSHVDVDPRAVGRAVGGGASANAPVSVDCPAPGPVHGHVGVLPPTDFDRRLALAAAARSLGHTASKRDALDDARERLSSLSLPSVDLRAARRRVSEAGDEEERLREHVAELRGRLAARREMGADTATVEDELASTVARLSEAETERIAAEQALARAERAARTTRDRRERRFELEDRVANLEREVRADLAARVWDRFLAAVDAVPGDAAVGGTVGEYDGDPSTAALAIARLTPLDAPVVLDGVGCFEGVDAAATVLDAPVIRV